MAIDVNGREYARLSQLQVGDKVQVDADFTCMEPWATKIVKRRDDGTLYIECEEQQHALDGQLMDDDDSLVGIYEDNYAVRGS